MSPTERCRADLFGVQAAGGVEASRAGTATTRIIGGEAANDALRINGLDGDDVINIGPGVDALIQLQLNP
jgi:hypothetical protein